MARNLLWIRKPGGAVVHSAGALGGQKLTWFRALRESPYRSRFMQDRSLLLVCRTSAGKEKTMSIRECMETGSRFLHVAADELDNLLEQEFGGNT